MTTSEAAVALAERWTPRLVYALALAMAGAALVSGVLTTPLGARAESAGVSHTRRQLETLALALRAHEASSGELPAAIEAVAPTLPRGEHGLLDAWGTPIRYACLRNGGAVIFSLGSDGRSGGVDGGADLAVVLAPATTR